ncbi:MAG: hypothetical protein ACWGQW_23430 [bacterium]
MMLYAVTISGEVQLYDDRHKAEHEAVSRDTIVEIVDVIDEDFEITYDDEPTVVSFQGDRS